ncbi:hypothetical protein ACPRNU_09790 [Chromobacterium vaccinii]|uniref:hypothetical protein n=1 Tax=Chromobacterium vaccinii TaxID=1108595 RepID=UPI003C776008
MKIQDDIQKQLHVLQNAMPEIHKNFGLMKELLAEIQSQPFIYIEHITAHLQTNAGPHVRITVTTEGIRLDALRELVTKRNLSINHSILSGDIYIHSEPWAVLVISDVKFGSLLNLSGIA